MSRFPDRMPAWRVPDPMAAPALRWGVLGTGWIADRFVSSCHSSTRQRFAAVGSRSVEAARHFADNHGMAVAHDSYEALVSDPEVDIVYVATPHNFHVEHGLLAIEAGKHVLIEKPIALNSQDLERLYEAADRRQVMCQEALWSFFLPKWDVVRQLLDDGTLGTIQTIIADHGEWLPPGHRIHDAGLAGGSLHDLGAYVFAVSAWVSGRPDTVLATGIKTPTGVMGDVAVAMQSEAGVVSSLSTTMLTTTPCRAIIAGSDAWLTTDDGFFFPGGLTLTDNRTERRLRFEEPNIGHEALFWEAAEVARRIDAGELSCPCWTRKNSRDTTATLDAVNAQLGIA